MREKVRRYQTLHERRVWYASGRLVRSMVLVFDVPFIVLIIPLLTKGQVSSISITRIIPNDVLNGGVICPNLYPVEFICIGVEVTALQWQRNGAFIGGAFTGFSNEGDVQQLGSLTLFLDSIITRNVAANMTSRLVGNISNLISGDRIKCASMNTENTVTLNYSLRVPPSAVPTNLSVSIETDIATVNISITWDSAFSLVHNVTSYRLSVASGGSAASCPSSCDPSGSCQCTGLRVGENTTITISAINCGDRVGPSVPITATPQVPSTPSECSALPVYSSAGGLNEIDLTWTVVNNPPEFLPGISQDVTQYSIIEDARDLTAVVPRIVCSTSICSYTYSFRSSSLPSSPISVSVLAQNVVGRGRMCTPQTEIGSRNQVFSLILNITIPVNQTVACAQLSGRPGTFECEFCYSAGDSCQNLTTCISVTGTPTVFPSLTEHTYCYRATASVNGTAVAVIQDTFNTACPLHVLGTAIDEQTNRRCSSDTLRSVSIPNGVGCVSGDIQGSMTTYQCDKWYTLSGGSHQTCMGDGNWDGEVPECAGLNIGNIALLVLSILLWALSTTMIMTGIVALKKATCCKHGSLLNFQTLSMWSKATCVVLLVIEFLFLLIVLLLWITFSVILETSSSESQQTSLLIAAFILALLALLWITGALIFLYIATKCCSDESACQTDAQKIEKNDLKISSKEAYGDTLNSDGGVEEIIYNYPQISFDSTIEAKQNEAYATNIATQGNEAYATASIAL